MDKQYALKYTTSVDPCTPVEDDAPRNRYPTMGLSELKMAAEQVGVIQSMGGDVGPRYRDHLNGEFDCRTYKLEQKIMLLQKELDNLTDARNAMNQK